MALKEVLAERGAGAKSIPATLATDTPQASPAQGAETVTFYHWIGKHPSSEIIKISGGERQVAADGQVMHKPLLEAHFHNGVLCTADPVVIAEIRRIAAFSGNITEDRETYYANTMTPQQVSQRSQRLAKQAIEDNRRLTEENSRLKAMLEAAGKD